MEDGSSFFQAETAVGSTEGRDGENRIALPEDGKGDPAALDRRSEFQVRVDGYLLVPDGGKMRCIRVRTFVIEDESTDIVEVFGNTGLQVAMSASNVILVSGFA